MKTIVSLVIILILFGNNISSQNIEDEYLECLIGTTINNPTLHKLLKENKWVVKKYSYADNRCKIAFSNDRYLLIENNVITYIFSDGFVGWHHKIFPKSWGILGDYKQMKKTDKSYPKQPKYKKKYIDNYVDNVWITKEIGNVEVKVNYRYRDVYADYETKRVMTPTTFELRCKGKNTNCGEVPEPPNVYDKILGNNGENLTDWICENFGKPVSADYLASNYLPVSMTKDYDETPRFEDGDYYAYHPILPGQYYLSFDATILLRLENDTLKGIGLYPQLIDREIFPGIDNDISIDYLNDNYGRQDNYMRDDWEYFFRTNSLEIMFHFVPRGHLKFVWINQLFCDKPLIAFNEFPLKDHKNGRTIVDLCGNYELFHINNKNVISVGNYYNGIPYGTHREYYRYGVEKYAFYPSLESVKNAYYSPEQKEKLASIILPKSFSDTIRSHHFKLDEVRNVKVKGEYATIYKKLESYYRYLAIAIGEDGFLIRMNMEHYNTIDKSKETEGWYAHVQESKRYNNELEGRFIIFGTGDYDFEKEYVVKVYIYKKME